MIEFLSQMTALDIIFMLFWVTAIVFGAATGIVRQVMVIVSMIVGILVGSLAAGMASHGTGMVSGLGAQNTLAFTYSFLVVLVSLIFYALAHRTYPATRLAGQENLDRVGGVILGFVAGLIGVMQLVTMLLFVTDGSWAIVDGLRSTLRGQLDSTPFLPLLFETFSFVRGPINSLIPSL